MSQSVQTDQGKIKQPGAYAEYDTEQTNSGFASTGIVVLVGEADAGPDYTLEADLDANAFGPDEESAVLAKYVSGQLVDAYKKAVTPSRDSDIPGAPSLIKIVKTNPSAQASLALPKIGGGTYGTLTDSNYGRLGNLFTSQNSAAPAEVVPTTGSLTFIPPADDCTLSIRTDGGATNVVSVTAALLPSALVAALAAIASLSVTGGVARIAAPGGGATAAVAVAGNQIIITSSTAWAHNPVVGDTLVIGAASAIKGGASQNVGSYVITAVTGTTATAQKLADGAAGVAGTITAPVVVAAVAATTADFEAYSPVTISRTTGVIDGIGKALTITRTAGTESIFFVLGTTTPAPVFNSTATPTIFTSASEYAVTLNVSRALDGVNVSMAAGGEIALQIGYLGTTASYAITGTTMTLTTTGGVGTSPIVLDLTMYPTLSDLVAHINALDGWTASLGNISLGTLPCTALDDVTGNCCSSTASAADANRPAVLPGRIKIDAYRFYNAVIASGTVSMAASAAAGLPDVMNRKAFAGGLRGATTQAGIQAAIDALEGVDCNFVVPLVSQNAAADIALGLTDSGSTYSIDSVNAYVLAHCNSMSKITARKNRQGVVSKRDTFANCKTAAKTLAAARVAMAFQDVMSVGTSGLAQFQPWMNAVEAASMQAAGGYKAIFNKVLGINGAVQNAKDFNPKFQAQVDAALDAGLLPIKKSSGFRYISDQTCYSKDENPVWNSMQAIYAADTVAMTAALRMEQSFVGKTLAQVSATTALSFLETIMVDMINSGFLARSDDAQRGFRNAKIKIVGPAMQVECEIYLATALYFVTIKFQVNQVRQTAQQ